MGASGGRAARHLRPRPVTLALLGVSAAVLLLYLVEWLTQVSDLRAQGSDFSASYVAGLVLQRDGGALLYNQTLEHTLHASLLPSSARFDLPFITPPSTAAMALPFTLLPLTVAYRVFALVQVALVVAAVVVVGRNAPWSATAPRERLSLALVALAGTGTSVMLLLGQWDGLNVLALALAYRGWRTGHPRSAVAWLTVLSLIAKPHLAVGLAAFVLGRRRRQEVATAALAALGVGLSWLAISDVNGVGSFVSAVVGTVSHTPPASTLGFLGLLASWFGDGRDVTIASLGLSVVAVAACVGLGAWSTSSARFELCLSSATALSLVAAPHLLAHDMVILTPAVVWTYAAISHRNGRWRAAVLGGWLLLALTTALDAGNAAPAPPGRLVPWALCVIAIACAWAAAQLPSGQSTSTRVVASTSS